MSASAPNAATVLLRGGLGNQLFQLAAGYRVLGVGTGTLQLLSYGNEWGPGHPDVRSLLGIDVQYPHRMYRSMLPGVAVRESWKDSISISMALALVSGWVTDTRFVSQSDPYAPFALQPARAYVLDGFFQHRDWWMPTWQRVAEQIREREPRAATDLRGEGVAAVKLRRSDYLGRGIVLVEDYYRDAIEMLGLRDQPVTVICEDPIEIDAFSRLLSDYGCVVRKASVFTGNPNIDDFWNLTAATTHVLANSSYSWWAAAVSQIASPSTRVAYPSPWLPNAWSNRQLPDMGIEGWIAVGAAFE